MNKLFVFLLLLLSINLNAQETTGTVKFSDIYTGVFEMKHTQWLKSAEISIGLEDRNMEIPKIGVFPYLTNTQFTQIDIAVSPPILNNNLYFYTSYKTWLVTNRIYSYKPLQVEYWAGMSYKFNDFKFSLEHMCSHSVDTYLFRESINRITLSYKLF
jgi:hypothetical protein